jgi:hypothetical protein
MARTLLLLMLIAPSLAAQEVSPSGEPKPVILTGPDKYKIDTSAECFQRIRDNAPFVWKVNGPKELDLYMEERAYEEVLLHAAKFSAEELDAHARRDVQFQSLIDTERLSFKLQLIRLEGRLQRLQRVEVNQSLKEQGIEAVYEAWIFPFGESTPVCAFVTQLPTGLAPQKDLKETINRPVAVAGYYFKLVQYEQQRFDRNNPGKHKISGAPVLIGRSLTLLPADAGYDASSTWQSAFVPLIVAGFTGVGVILVFLSWRYRREDRAILEQSQRTRNQNPFEAV